MKKRMLSFVLALCLVATMFPALSVNAFAAEKWEKYTELSTVSGSVLKNGRYKVTSDTTKDNLQITGNVTIYIAEGATLTAKGSNASGTTAGKAGIYLPSGSTLTLLGDGALKATGGNAANGTSGTNGTANLSSGNFSGGIGGNGGGGAGAGIGLNGGNGAAAVANDSGKTGAISAGAMGTLNVTGTVTVTAVGGTAGKGGSGGSGASYISDPRYDFSSKKTYYMYFPGSGGGGGGGGGGASCAIGYGGCGGASGGAGVSTGGGSTEGKYATNGGNGVAGASGSANGGSGSGGSGGSLSEALAFTGDGLGKAGASGSTIDFIGGIISFSGGCTINGVAGSALVDENNHPSDCRVVTWTALSTEIKFADANTESSTTAVLPKSQSTEDGDSPERPNDPTKTGYTFDNWYDSEACTDLYDFGTAYDAGSMTVTVYAKFIPNEYTVSFDQTGGENGQQDTVTATFDKPLSGSVSVPTMSDCEFLGYFSEKDGGTQYFDQNGDPTAAAWTIPNNATLYAQWNDPRTVSIDAQQDTPTHGVAGSSTYVISASGFDATVFEPVIEWDNDAPAGVTTDFSAVTQTGGVLSITTTEETPAGIYKFKIKSKNSPQETKTVAFNVWEDLSKVDYSVKDNTISNTTASMEYKLSGDDWTSCKDGTTNVTFAEGQQLIIRDKNFPERTREVMDTALAIPTAPTSGVSYSVKDGTVSGLGDEYEYSLNGGEWTTADSDIAFVPGSIRVRTKATDRTLASEPEALTSVPDVANAPAYAIDYTNETTTTAVSSSDEYKKDDGKWTSGKDEVISLTPGSTYIFRTAATDAALTSKEQTITAPVRPADPKEDKDYKIDYENESIALEDGYALSTSKSFDTLIPSGGKLEAGTKYYVRKQATADAFKSNTVSFTTAPAIEAPEAPTVASKTDEVVIVDAILGQEYAIRKVGDSDYGAWQTSATFSGLEADTKYEIATRISAVSTGKNKSFPSKVSDPITVKTMKTAADAPALDFEEITTTTVTIKPVDGAEYSSSATKQWQDSNVFENLEPGKKYTFYIRMKATDDTPGGKITNSVIYTKNAAPKDDVASIDYSKETISFDDSMYEVNTKPDGTGDSVASGSSITDLITADGSSLYIRAKEGLSEGSDWTEVKIAARPAAPALDKTDETISNKKDGTLSGVTTDMEYKIGDGEWQDVTDTPLTGFSNETVSVRTKASDSAPRSEEASYTFTPSTETLTVSYDLNGGTGTIDSATGLAYGDTLAAPSDVPTMEGASFAGWTTDKDGKNAFAFDTDKVTDNMTLYAQWTYTQFDITLPADVENGSISADPKSAVKGDEVTITVTPDEEYSLKDLTVTDKDGNKIDLTDKGDGKYSFTMPVGDVDVKASFEKNTYDITLPADVENGSISADPKSAAKGDEVTITVTPDEGYSLKDLTVTDKDGNKIDLTDKGDGKYSFTMPVGDVDVKASFEKNTYDITLPADVENGSISADPKSAAKGDEVTITVTPDEGYSLKDLTVTDKDGNKIDLTDKGDGKYSFTMPSGKVDVKASFEKDSKYNDSTADCPKDETCPIDPFKDSKATDWYHDGVHFCLENKLMVGFEDGTFRPNTATSRAMITTILWRLEGEPTADYTMSFRDVQDGRWYTEAIRWAQSVGVVKGYNDTTFGVDDTMTREQMMTVLYRYAQYKGYDVSAQAELSAFSDAGKVSNYAATAAKWAVSIGIIVGDKQSGTIVLNPQGSSTRAQAATMLMRYCTTILK